MELQDIVNKLLIWSLLLVVIVAIVCGIYSCTKYEASSPYITGITVYEQREHSIIDSDYQDITHIEVDPKYSFIDYNVDYENERVVINLQKNNRDRGGKQNESNN